MYDLVLKLVLFANSVLVLAIMVVYYLGARRSEQPYKMLKIGMVISMIVIFTVHIQLLSPITAIANYRYVFIHGALTILLINIFFFGITGLKR